MADPVEMVNSNPGWAYLIILASIAGSAVVPILPSETMIFTAGALAAAGELDPVLVVLVGAAGSLLGDGLGYLVGRMVGDPALRRVARGERGRRSLLWSHRTLDRRGGPVIAASRFVPGGQTAVSLIGGSLRFPKARYAAWACLGALVWGAYGTLVGSLGGNSLRSGDWLGLVVAVVLGVIVAVAARLLRGQRGEDSSPSR